jgi:FtsP/CotA-like multicopper oxidase with cupredoxin domain
MTRILGALLTAAILSLAGAGACQAAIDGLSGTTFNLVARTGHISTADGNSILVWGYANADAGNTLVQYPGPTLIVDQGVPITINLKNELQQPVSIIFPGQTGVVATGGVPGLLTREAAPGATVTYTFTPGQPGTYLYQSGTRQDLQVEMGLVGALIVRPTGFAAMMTPQAYGDPATAYDDEGLFLLTEMDSRVHDLVEAGRLREVNTTTFFPNYWFINGRAAPDTMAPANAEWLPTQPYDAMPVITPGQRYLIRWIGAGRDLHPFHTHGNNFTVIARDGRLLSTSPGVSGANLGVSNFTQTVEPGATYDAFFTWTGRELGWDFFGHKLTDPVEMVEVYAETTLSASLGAGGTVAQLTSGVGFPSTHRFRALIWTGASISDPVGSREAVWMTPSGGGYTVLRAQEGTAEVAWDAGANVTLTDHGRPFPVILPNVLELTFGAFYSGSPFLGAMGSLPPGEGGMNPNGGYFFMWHSHNEKEMTNNDIFPGGLMTMFLVDPPWAGPMPLRAR